MVGYITHKCMVKGIGVALRNVNRVPHQTRVGKKHHPKENTNKLNNQTNKPIIKDQCNGMVELTRAKGHATATKNQSENCLNQLLACDMGMTSVKNARKKCTPTTHYRDNR